VLAIFSPSKYNMLSVPAVTCDDKTDLKHIERKDEVSKLTAFIYKLH